MKTVGIVAEYNPFHNGHLYQLTKAKEVTGADFVVVVMSGDFVQRGYPAFMDKWKRTTMALLNGADLVIELPVRYATASAEYFAKGAISILENLGCIDSICFGSETGSIEDLKKIADYIHKDCDVFNKELSFYVKSGDTYPVARKKAILNHFHDMNADKLEELLSSPNNILGIEYLKALSSINSTIEPYTISRVCTGYHEDKILEQKENSIIINSATSIRNQFIHTTDMTNIQSSVPSACYDILLSEYRKSYPIEPNDLSDFLFYRLITLTDNEILQCLDLSEDLLRRIRNFQNNYTDFTSFSNVLKSKQLTSTRINRSLLHLILNIQKMNIKEMSAKQIVPYIRVLGLKKHASIMLKNAKEQNIPVITKMANAKNLLSDDSYEILKEDIFASTLYQRMIYKKFGTVTPNEFQKSPIIQ